MTQMALREKRSGIKLDNYDDPDRRAFISFYWVRSFFQETIIYLAILFLVLVFVFSTFTFQVSKLYILITVFGGIIGYMFFLLALSGYTRRKILKRFAAYQNIVREQRKDLKILEDIYEKEERESHGQQEKTDRNEWDEDRFSDSQPHQ